jgi:poly(A) polymerase
MTLRIDTQLADSAHFAFSEYDHRTGEDSGPGTCSSGFSQEAGLQYVFDLIGKASGRSHESSHASQKAFQDAMSGLLPASVGALLMQILESPRPSACFAVLDRMKVLELLYPEIAALKGIEERTLEMPDGEKRYHHKDVYAHTMLVLDRVAAQTTNVWLRMAALLHDIAKPATKAFQEGIGWTFHGHPEVGARFARRLFKRLEISMDKCDYVKRIVVLHQRPMALVQEGVSDSAIRRLLVDADGYLDDLLLLCRADVTSKNPALVKAYLRNYDLLVSKTHELCEMDELRSWQPPIGGAEIMELCGLEPGVIVGVIKDRLEEAILTGRLANDAEAAKAFVLSILGEVAGEKEIPKKVGLKKSLKRLPDTLKT